MTNEKQWKRDLALIRQTLDGDEEAVARFADRMKCIPRFLGSINRRAHRSLSIERLQEASQEVALRVWRDRSAFTGHSVIETWVYRYSAHVFQESLKAQSKAEFRRAEHEEIHTILASDLDASDQLHLDTEAGRIRQAMRHLPPSQVELIERKLFLDQPFSFLADELGENINTIKARYYRALTALQRAIRADETAKSYLPKTDRGRDDCLADD
ncbi:ECF RNA polymerase sigma factor RpoE [Planctomycetes bacterium Poly30]|uniref:ECF RNA polymerase sigma factor RpoE n=1 Tax=Saltatorellus ferox TaxID=2528018 RepID=A0A518EQ33_9BACT|nr:ECF RNA polymerase sigma factor RpoE [Planctomycetes bacterium Poly30]